MTLNLVVVERDRLARLALEQLLNATYPFRVVGTAGCVANAQALPAATAPAIVLAATDALEGEVSGGVGQLLTRFPTAKLVLLGADSDRDAVVTAFRAGASGFLTRNMTPDGLIRALQGIQRGEMSLPRGLTHLLVTAIRSRPVNSINEGSIDVLSPREREVLAEMSNGRSNAEIAARLHVGESTVKTHVSNILRKTGYRSRFALRAHMM